MRSTRETSDELSTEQLDRISGGDNGLSRTIIPFTPPPPGPPIVLHRGPLGGH